VSSECGIEKKEKGQKKELGGLINATDWYSWTRWLAQNQHADMNDANRPNSGCTMEDRREHVLYGRTYSNLFRVS
jgi:hypothetical protein